MNEIIFFSHICIVFIFSVIGLKMGRTALVAILLLQVVLSNLFVTKQIQLFTLNVTCCDVFAVGSLFCLNLLQNYYGEKFAKKTSSLMLLSLAFVVAMSQLQIAYTPSKFDAMHPFFKAICSTAPRTMLVSILCSFCIQRIDIKTFILLKKLFKKLPFSVLFVCASLISQLCDTIIFTFFALHNLVSSIKDIIIMSYTIKVLIILSMATLTTFIKYARRNERIYI